MRLSKNIINGSKISGQREYILELLQRDLPVHVLVHCVHNLRKTDTSIAVCIEDCIHTFHGKLQIGNVEPVFELGTGGEGGERERDQQ